MLPNDLKDKLTAVDSSRIKRLETAQWMTEKSHYVRDTLQWCFTEESDLLPKASWVLELICKNQPHLFINHTSIFFERLSTIHNDSALRSCAKICEHLCYLHYRPESKDQGKTLTREERKKMTECCFDWLITDQKVACQAPAMEALYYLGKDKLGAWIYPELKNILTVNAPSKSAGYQARARKILKRFSEDGS